MNRRQKRALARKIPGYKDLLKEAAASSFNEFEEMLKKSWEKEEKQKTEKTSIEMNGDNNGKSN